MWRRRRRIRGSGCTGRIARSVIFPAGRARRLHAVPLGESSVGTHTHRMSSAQASSSSPRRIEIGRSLRPLLPFPPEKPIQWSTLIRRFKSNLGSTYSCCKSICDAPNQNKTLRFITEFSTDKFVALSRRTENFLTRGFTDRADPILHGARPCCRQQKEEEERTLPPRPNSHGAAQRFSRAESTGLLRTCAPAHLTCEHTQKITK